MNATGSIPSGCSLITQVVGKVSLVPLETLLKVVKPKMTDFVKTWQQ